MIEIVAEGTKVRVSIEGAGAIREWNFHFRQDCKDDTYAKLLAESINAGLRAVVSQNAEYWYNEGYKAGRGKKAKRNWFPSSISRWLGE